MSVLPAPMTVNYTQRPEEAIRSQGTRIIIWESPCGCWEFNPGPLDEQPVLLTCEPALQLHVYFCIYVGTYEKIINMKGFLSLECLKILLLRTYLFFCIPLEYYKIK